MVVFITGIGSGIGFETCVAFLSEGHDVIGVLRNDDQEQKIRSLSKNLSGNLQVINADFNDSRFMEIVNSEILSFRVTQLDALINIAGVLGVMGIDELTSTDMSKVFHVNFQIPVLLTQYFVPLLKVAKGNVLNITSMSGFQDSVRFAGLSVYGASKAALASVTQSLAVELSQYEIHINALAIGSVDTKMLQSAFPDYEAQLSPQEMASYIYRFSTHGYKFYNGKILPVAITNP